MLIPFPFAFLTGALGFDAAARIAHRPEWSATAAHLLAAGVVAALVAAVPGLVDYFGTVPPRSSARRRATWHLAVILAAVGLCAAAWLLRRTTPETPGLASLALELAGVGLLSAGGWMGGTLVSRNQIGVDHRYASAGKWREERVAEPEDGAGVRVATAGELEVDQMKLLRVGDRRIVLARIERGWVAFDDRCPHKGGSLAGGALVCGTVQCPWHGSQFDAVTGEVRAGPAARGIRAHRAESHGDEIRLYLEGGKSPLAGAG